MGKGKPTCSMLVDTGRIEEDSFTRKRYMIQRPCTKKAIVKVKTASAHYWLCRDHAGEEVDRG